jgi:hypothetical protein
VLKSDKTHCSLFRKKETVTRLDDTTNIQPTETAPNAPTTATPYPPIRTVELHSASPVIAPSRVANVGILRNTTPNSTNTTYNRININNDLLDLSTAAVADIHDCQIPGVDIELDNSTSIDPCNLVDLFLRYNSNAQGNESTDGHSITVTHNNNVAQSNSNDVVDDDHATAITLLRLLDGSNMVPESSTLTVDSDNHMLDLSIINCDDNPSFNTSTMQIQDQSYTDVDLGSSNNFMEANMSTSSDNDTDLCNNTVSDYAALFDDYISLKQELIKTTSERDSLQREYDLKVHEANRSNQ